MAHQNSLIRRFTVTQPPGSRESDNSGHGRNRVDAVDNTIIRFRAPNLAILRPAPLRKRLWQGGLALAVLVGTFAVGNFFIPKEKAVTGTMLGHDSLAFYAAGTFARTGRYDLLYNLDSTRELEHLIAARNGLEIGKGFGPYWNPPFYAWGFAPLSALPYPTARTLWIGLNGVCLLAAIILLARMLPAIVAHPPRLVRPDHPIPLRFRRDWRNWLLVPLLVCVSMPCIAALSHGQNTCTSLLMLTLVVMAWRNRMPVAAGLACGMLLYKPQLAIVVAGMLILTLGLRVCLGLGFVAGSLLVVSAITMPGSVGDYLAQLPLNLKFMQIDNAYLWERHVTLKALWRLLLQGRDAGAASAMVNSLTLITCTSIGLGLLLAWFRSRRPGIDDCWTGETRSLAQDRLIGATITAMPLLMPFYFDYDLLLLSVPATLLAGELLCQPPGAKLDRVQSWLVGCWVGLYLWMYVNPPLASASGVNLTTVLLTMIASLSIYRAATLGLRTTAIILPQVQRVQARRAA